jgi:putative ABC transport system ATP-binding protein
VDGPAIRIEGVVRTHPAPGGGRVEALRVDRWEVAPGARVALVGESGAGKSTLLHLLAGLALPDRGRVEVLGTDIASLDEAARDRYRGERVGLVFQSLNLFPALTARENLLAAPLFSGRAGREDGARADALLERVGLGARGRHRPGQLSLGEQQRVAIARALMNRPALLLCDEPTGSLDARRRAEVVALLREVAAEASATLVVVTHDPAVVAEFPETVRLADLAGPRRGGEAA